MSMLNLKAKYVKEYVQKALDRHVSREMPDNLAETEYLTHDDVNYYGSLREAYEAFTEYVDEHTATINNLERQLEDLQKQMLELSEKEVN